MASPRVYSTSDLELIEAKARLEARESFWAYRQMLDPEMLISWWQRDVAMHLESFWQRMKAGERPIMLIMAPPQHGKSRQIVEFASWVAGQDPDIRAVYASFSDDLGTRANRDLQRIYDGKVYKGVFPDTRIGGSNVVTMVNRPLRNSSLLQYVDRAGSFMNTTVQGPITGMGVDLGIIDDPIKGRAEANSATIRNRAWEWLNDDFMTRLSKNAGVLGIMTRWHVDDPFGRLIEMNPNVTVLRYPAIAEHDEPHRKAGEALFPEHKPLEFLAERRRDMGSASWEALYQQNPVVAGGEILRTEWWQYWRASPSIEWRGIWADTAQKTKEASDYTVFQCWGRTTAGQAILLDQVRGKWEAPELLTQARAFWNKHKSGPGPLRSMNVEDAVSGTGLIQTLKREGIPVKGITRQRDKLTRIMDVAPSIEAGQVFLPQEAPWLSDFLAEAEAFPNGAHDDQVDPMADAVADIVGLRGGYRWEGAI